MDSSMTTPAATWPDEATVDRVARAMMDGTQWQGAFDAAGVLSGYAADRDVWRRHARAALSALAPDLAALRAENARLREALGGMVREFEKFCRYGSPMASAANEALQAARAALATPAPGADRAEGGA